MDALEQIERRRERWRNFGLGQGQMLHSMAQYQMSGILYLNPMPRYAQAEADVPSPAGTTGWAFQLTLDNEGGLWFSNGPYIGTPGGSLSLGWLSPRTALRTS